jgi:quercetin dioxygenase-like cupin family protein
MGRHISVNPLDSKKTGPRGIVDVKAVPAVQIENERVIVTEWTFAPGAETGQHVHAFDYVVVPLTSGTLHLIEPEGSRDALPGKLNWPTERGRLRLDLEVNWWPRGHAG